MREMTKCRDKKLMGVAGGIAEYLDMDRTIMRAIWVFGGIVVPPVILAYIILGLVMPEARPLPGTPAAPAPAEPAAEAMPPFPGAEAGPRAEAGPQAEAGAPFEAGARTEAGPQAEPVYTRQAYRPLTKSRDKWLSGVCGGIAEYFSVDPIIIRALWLVSVFFFGSGLLLYIILAILMPQPRPEYRPF